MTNEPSPRPWRIPEVGLIPTEIWSADGIPIARGVAGPNAALIVAAVNERETHNRCEKRYDKDGDEMPPHCAFQSLKLDHALGQRDAAIAERDRLRDIVRRLADTADDYASLLLSTGERDAGVMDIVTGLVAEARAAIGETQP